MVIEDLHHEDLIQYWHIAMPFLKGWVHPIITEINCLLLHFALKNVYPC